MNALKCVSKLTHWLPNWIALVMVLSISFQWLRQVLMASHQSYPKDIPRVPWLDQVSGKASELNICFEIICMVSGFLECIYWEYFLMYHRHGWHSGMFGPCHNKDNDDHQSSPQCSHFLQLLHECTSDCNSPVSCVEAATSGAALCGWVSLCNRCTTYSASGERGGKLLGRAQIDRSFTLFSF